MITKSIRLTEEEAASLRRYVELTGEVEANVLKRAALRGLGDLRLERAIARYLETGDSHKAGEIAGIGRAPFLWEAMERGVQILRGPSRMEDTLQALGTELGDERLIAAGRKLAASKQGAQRSDKPAPAKRPERELAASGA